MFIIYRSCGYCNTLRIVGSISTAVDTTQYLYWVVSTSVEILYTVYWKCNPLRIAGWISTEEDITEFFNKGDYNF